MIQRGFVWVIIVISCSLLFSCKKDSPKGVVPPIPPVSGKTYSADEIIAFKQLTIKRTGNKIVKWPKNVSFYLVHTEYPHMTKEVDDILNEVNQLLGDELVLTRTNDWLSASISIFLTDRARYITAEPEVQASLENSSYTGMAYLKWNEGVFTRGSVFVDMDKTKGDIEQQRYLIHHEIMHALGFYGHVSLSGVYTLMYHSTIMPYILDYTAFDKRMMQLLYNPAIKGGMNEEQFNLAVKDL
jgi:hypothetical protein